jgi:hypothetical protein
MTAQGAWGIARARSNRTGGWGIAGGNVDCAFVRSSREVVPVESGLAVPQLNFSRGPHCALPEPPLHQRSRRVAGA